MTTTRMPRRARLPLALAVVLALATQGAAADQPVTAGVILGNWNYGTTRGISTWDGQCYVGGSPLPGLLDLSGHAGTWELASFFVGGTLRVCGDVGPVLGGVQPIGADCLANSGHDGDGTLVLDLGKPTPEVLEVHDANWKAASNGVIVMTASVRTSSGAETGQLVAIVWLVSLFCPTSWTSALGTWAIMPPAPH